MKPPQAGLIVDPKPLVIQITIDNDTGNIQMGTSRDIPGLYLVWVFGQLQSTLGEQGLASSVANTSVKQPANTADFTGRKGGN